MPPFGVPSTYSHRTNVIPLNSPLAAGLGISNPSVSLCISARSHWLKNETRAKSKRKSRGMWAIYAIILFCTQNLGYNACDRNSWNRGVIARYRPFFVSLCRVTYQNIECNLITQSWETLLVKYLICTKYRVGYTLQKWRDCYESAVKIPSYGLLHLDFNCFSAITHEFEH